MNDPAFLFYPGDYLRDTQTLSEKTQVAYDRIICEHMRNICITQSQLKFFTKRLNPEEVDELMFVLTKVNGGYQIAWVAESINKRKAYSESRRKNRASKKVNNISSSYVQHMENENENENEEEKERENGYEIVPTFEMFWDFYDKKVGDKNKIERIWKRLKQSERESIMNHLEFYVHSTPDKAFRKNPQTYLNNRGWEDEIIKKKNGKKLDINKIFITD